jgi:hypothetical protein
VEDCRAIEAARGKHNHPRKAPLKNAWFTFVAAALLAAVLAAPVLAADPEKGEAAAENVVTVYVSAHAGTTVTKKLNELHANMEAEGWRFADLEIHVENGDTTGAWVTYTR